jgi:lysophospholipase L1-like esterase
VKRQTSLGLLVGLAFVALAAVSNGFAQANKVAAKKAKPNPVYAPITDVASLPRVLLIGDSISIGYTLAVRELLAGKANVHRPPTNCGPTIRGLEQIDAWLGDARWDVIHVNFGLHDLKIMEDGKHQVPLEQYEQNLRQIVQRLKKSSDKVIWCSTTPVPESSNPPRHNADVLAYNAAAKRVANEHGLAIDDLYGFALPQLDKLQIPNNVHFTPDGSRVLAKQVAESIAKATGK